MVKPAKKPVVSREEESFRKKLFPDPTSIKNKNMLCTSCNSSVKGIILKGKPITHPFLDTLLCEKCKNFFGDGDFSADEDGSDKYCRWCGQGGTLYLCSKCTAGFCKKCIKRNLPRSALNEVEKDDWLCYCCNVKPLFELRAYCWAAKALAGKNSKSKLKNEDEEKEKAIRKRKSRTGSSDRDESDDSGPSKKTKSDDDEKVEEGREKQHKRKTRESNSNKDSVSNTPSKKRKLSADDELDSEEVTQISKKRKSEMKLAVEKVVSVHRDVLHFTNLISKKVSAYGKKGSLIKMLKTPEDVDKVIKKLLDMCNGGEKTLQTMRENIMEFHSSWKALIEENDEDIKNEGTTEDNSLEKDEDEGNNLRQNSTENEDQTHNDINNKNEVNDENTINDESEINNSNETGKDVVMTDEDEQNLDGENGDKDKGSENSPDVSKDDNVEDSEESHNKNSSKRSFESELREDKGSENSPDVTKDDNAEDSEESHNKNSSKCSIESESREVAEEEGVQ